MASTDIVGYTFRAENLCVSCTAAAVGWTGAGDQRTFIDNAGRLRGVNVDDERSYDSGDWPKVIFDSQVEDPDERCGSCGESLVG